MEKKCIMTQSVVEVIHKESLSAFEMRKETGGILIGPSPTESAVVITSATGPGPDGKCASFASWETDPDYLNAMLKKARDENPAVDLRGFWHRHPGQMSHPSGQDLSEARKILKDTKHYKLNELVMPIVTATQKRITFQAYYITCEEPRFKEISLEVVLDGDEMVKSLLSSHKVVGVEEKAGFGFWQDKDSQFYKTAYGAARLQEELERLKLLGYEAAARLLSDGNCCIEVWEGEGRQRTLFLLPREYPLNAPQVFIRNNEHVRELKADSSSPLYSPLYRWSSMFYLSELIGTLREQVRKHTDKGRIRFEILAAIKKDLRYGNCDMSRLRQQLVRLVRGKEKCS